MTSCLLVVALLRDHNLRRAIGQERLGLGDVRFLSRRHEQNAGVPDSVGTLVDLRAEAAAPATKRLIVLAASPVPCFSRRRHTGASTEVEWRISTCNSGSHMTAARAANRPALAHRSNRRHWLFQW